MSDKLAAYQEVANRGIQSKLTDEQRIKFDELLVRGLITLPEGGDSFGAVDFENDWHTQDHVNAHTNPLVGVGRSVAKTKQAFGQLGRNMFSSDEGAEAYQQKNALDTEVWDKSASGGMIASEVGGDIAQFAVPMTKVAKGAQALNMGWKTMIPVGLTAAAEDAFMQTGEGADEFDTVRLGLAAGFGAGGEFIAPWASKIVSKFKNMEEGSVIEKGATVVREMGLKPEDFTNGQLVQFAKDAESLAGNVTDAAKAGRAEFNLHYTKGEQTGDFKQMSLEEQMRGSTSPSGEIMRESDKLRQQSIDDAVEAMQDSFSQGQRRVGDNYRDAGSVIIEDAQNQSRILNEQIDDAYKALREQDGKLKPEALEDLPQRARNAVEQSNIIADSETPATLGAFKLIDDKVDEYSQVQNPLDMSYEARMARAKEQGFDVDNVYYHGTGSLDNLKGFDYKYTGDGADQYGAGFYITNSGHEASGYAKDLYRGRGKYKSATPGVVPSYTKEANLLDVDGAKQNHLGEVIRLDEGQVRQVLSKSDALKRSPDDMDEMNPLGDWYESFWDGGAEDWMIDDLAARHAGRNPEELMDFFDGDSENFLRALSDVTGYDGLRINFRGGLQHQVHWKPENIRSINAAFDPKQINSGNLIDDLSKINIKKDVDANKVERIRQNISSQIGKAKNPTDKRAAITVKNEFDNWLDDAVDNALFDGDIDALKNARSLRAEYGRKFQASHSKDEGGKFMKKVLDEGRTPEEVINYLTGASKLGLTGQGAARKVQQLKMALGEDSDAILALKEAALVKIVKGKKIDGVIGALKNALEGQPSFMKELYTPEELAKISRFKQAIDVYKQDGKIPNNSNTAQMLGRMFEQFTRVLPWVTGNPFVGVGVEGAAQIGKQVGKRKVQRWTQPMIRRKEMPLLPATGAATANVAADDQ